MDRCSVWMWGSCFGVYFLSGYLSIVGVSLDESDRAVFVSTASFGACHCVFHVRYAWAIVTRFGSKRCFHTGNRGSNSLPPPVNSILTLVDVGDEATKIPPPFFPLPLRPLAVFFPYVFAPEVSTSTLTPTAKRSARNLWGRRRTRSLSLPSFKGASFQDGDVAVRRRSEGRLQDVLNDPPESGGLFEDDI